MLYRSLHGIIIKFLVLGCHHISLVNFVRNFFQDYTVAPSMVIRNLLDMRPNAVQFTKNKLYLTYLREKLYSCDDWLKCRLKS